MIEFEVPGPAVAKARPRIVTLTSKSGVYGNIDKEWDADFVTVLIQKVGDVKVKERAKEVKQV
jgi:hypothetical protein